MRSLEAYQRLKFLEPTFSTNEAGGVLKLSSKQASLILSRLAKQNTIVRLVKGRWAYSDRVDPLLLPNVLTYPIVSYVSLYTALYYHGMIEQIPDIIFAVSIGKTKHFDTPLATVSIHRISSFLFSGYEYYGKSAIMMATPEKALFDTFYLTPAKSHRFKTLTELELPETFDMSAFEPWIEKIKHPGRQIMVRRRLAQLDK